MSTEIVIDVYCLDTQQKFDDSQITLTQATTIQIKSAQDSNLVDLLKALISAAQKETPELYGEFHSVQPVSTHVTNTEYVLIQLRIRVKEVEQANQLRLLIEHAVQYGASYLQRPGKFNCLCRDGEFEIPENKFALIESVTEKYLQELFKQTYRTRKFTGLRLLGSQVPRTLAVKRVLNPVGLGATGELIELSGIVKHFDRSGVIDFHPDDHDPTPIHFEPRSFQSAEHELYYHATDARFNRTIKLMCRLIDGKRWLVPIDLTAQGMIIVPKQLTEH